ncbi:uncharacterized protein LTR77_001929 [Saxophila tyrrhenica]|uniref:Zn(2)-C6 fungal-type domain-containing protein n=1 Tax=Saxophila tyrrhenica TaxID=1690608 RepID=A0AAV9PKP8_9PEZI|nr:hypothetical protein LTR77_001929 [Saxophila tyrrhenica]
MSHADETAAARRQRKARTRATAACSTCRGRRTRCDNQRPSCGFCRNNGLDCHYDQTPQQPPSRVEVELAAIKQRLDDITTRLPPPATIHHAPPSQDFTPNSGHHAGHHVPITEEEKSPFQLLGIERTMTSLGLEPGFAEALLQLERSPPVHASAQTSRMRIMQQQTVLDALAAFSAHIHPFYSVFRPGFSQRHLQVMSGPLSPSCESFLSLVVTAVGVAASQDFAFGSATSDASAVNFVDAAMSSLPDVVVDSGLISVQCLLLLSIYYCCTLQPCRAYDYVVIASLKVQNLMKSQASQDDELAEQVRRAFWALLLLECELRAQFDRVGSRIQYQDDDVALPDGRRPWHLETEVGSPQESISPTMSMHSMASNELDTTQSYFLAEIAMRRMLNRCNTAIRRTSDGHIVYAPAIAVELELQLDNWYTCLPPAIRFDYHQDLDFDLLTSPSLYPRTDNLGNFLRVQYYCCKISIYWPAAYQCIQDGIVTLELLQHCERFFNAYIQLMPSILMAVRECMVHRWTLYASIFMTSMAVLKAASTVGIRQGCAIDWSRLVHCLQSTQRVDQRIAKGSGSLSLLSETLSERLRDFLETHAEGVDGYV